jgi:mannosyltransferase OCH1-like enzyme
MNYIGSKFKLSPFIKETVYAVCGGDLSKKTFCDLFAGTGIVGRMFKKEVKSVISNDIEYYSFVLNKNYIENHTPLKYQNYVDELNNFINNYFNSTTNWNNTIPQIIHWSWISDDDLSIEIANNIRIWKERNSNWLIIKWNDSYFKNNPFVQSAIKAGKYATASDYIRLWALYNFGGIYLDSDCECIKSFDEELLSNKLLLGYEEGNYIAGHFLGAKLGHPIIKSVLDWYDDKIFDVSWLKQGPEPIEKNMPYTLPGLLTNLLRNEQLDIYPKDYFTAKNYATKETYVTENTYILHQYAASWLKDNSKKEFQINDFGFKN